jgi:uncharacterized RDD family membrane protein YckC
MTPNLLHYSTHSQKISPAELEMNKTPPQFKTWKLLTAFLMDFYIVAMAASLMSFAFKGAVATLMATPTMSYSLFKVDMNSLSFSILPLLMVSYFFFSFYMNDGQTFGMKKFKLRLENTGYDPKCSLLWAARCSSVVLTFGFSMFFIKNIFQKSCLSHDHLYHTLMIQTEWAAPSLVERTTQEDISTIEENYIRAA